MITALLPMKGNSVRVLGKNLRPFAGEPLALKILRTLVSIDVIREILVNTDSAEIKNLVSQFPKIHCIDRPEALCGDTVPMNDIIKHDLDYCTTDHVLQTHCTNPLLTAATIQDAISQYFSNMNEYDSLFSVTRWQTRLYWRNSVPINHDPTVLLNTQDLDPVYEENSNIYIFSKSSFAISGNRRIGKKPLMYPINKLESIDIDEEEDFIMAEALCNWQSKTCTS
jgi:CMP-N-acetylneuraminic acid synthetase